MVCQPEHFQCGGVSTFPSLSTPFCDSFNYQKMSLLLSQNLFLCEFSPSVRVHLLFHMASPQIFEASCHVSPEFFLVQTPELL